LQECNWNQEEFEKHLAQWIVAGNQLFDEAKKPEFQTLLKYLLPVLSIPHQKAMRTHIMKMGEDMVDTMKKMFEVQDFQLKFH